ncbi:hypothetical protein XELAEV_18005574mg [Xenopus laevis]|uniref:Uncharacterized protein n=1 Tax=Xenopus laevis TaxID=8355 RepID=A0A974DXJ5_XENLA|nr:hypothetical protein XELAEV_18005574mg [Xenopus laevis]
METQPQKGFMHWAFEIDANFTHLKSSCITSANHEHLELCVNVKMSNHGSLWQAYKALSITVPLPNHIAQLRVNFRNRPSAIVSLLLLHCSTVGQNKHSGAHL